MATEQLDQNAPARNIAPGSIPNFDISALHSPEQAVRDVLVDDIRKACNTPGFFHVHNTCVSDELISACIKVTQQFFSSPDDGSLKQSVHNRHANGEKGWGPMFCEPAYQKDTVAHLESFDIGQPLAPEQYLALAIPANLWPDLPGFRDVVLAYYRAVTRMGRTIAEALSEILGMEREFLNSISGTAAPRTMRLLHYPPNDAPPDPCNVGISAHTDFECFTIMNQTAAGLELTTPDGQWCKAPHDVGTFTIILGDMTERFSNGTLKATGHRVVNTPWTRYSLILFFAVDGHYEVAPLPAFVSDLNPPRYAAITQAEHIRNELARATANLTAG